MKKIIIAVFSACLLISYCKAFQDRPALTKAENAAFSAIRNSPVDSIKERSTR